MLYDLQQERHMMLVKLFTSKLRAEILALFFSRPEEALYLGEIVKLTGEDRGNISRELRNLETIGLLISRKEGNLKYYSSNKDFLLYDELKSIILKTRGAVGALKETLSRAKKIEYAFIYGSIASGTETAKSDIDLMVIGKISLMRGPEKALGREINPSLYSVKEYKGRMKKKDPFIVQIMNEPRMMLIGDDDGLHGIAG
jgi:predicted nucleotidyltransferase/predicted transcriptional regulator with HTH domain